MSVCLHINNKIFQLSESRVKKIISENKEAAIHLGLWDKIKDLFRSEKKQAVLNQIYNLVCANNDNCESKLANQVHCFKKIKEMADPSQQYLFEIKNNQQEIIFSIGTTTIHTQNVSDLSINDQYFIEIYHTAQLNLNEDLKGLFASSLHERLYSEVDITLDHLHKDIGRSAYIIENETFNYNDGIPISNKRYALDQFLNKLTPKQQRSLHIVGTQIAPIELKGALSRVSEKHSFIVSPSPKYIFSLDNNQVIVNVSLKQNCESLEYFNIVRAALSKNEACYPKLALQASFSINQDGAINCEKFHIASYSDGIESAKLTAQYPCQYLLLNYMDKFIKDAEIEFSFLNIKNKKIFLDQEAQRFFMRKKLCQELRESTTENNKKMLESLEGKFGNRLASVLDFAAEKVALHEDNPVLISTTFNYRKVLDELIKVLRYQLQTGEDLGVSDQKDTEICKKIAETDSEAPLNNAAIIDSIDQLNTSEIVALSLFGIRESTLASR